MKEMVIEEVQTVCIDGGGPEIPDRFFCGGNLDRILWGCFVPSVDIENVTTH